VLIFLSRIHSSGMLLHEPQSASSSPRSMPRRCSALPDAEHVFEDRLVHIGTRALAGGAEDDFFALHHVVPCFGAGCVPHEADAKIAGDAADEIDVGEFELQLFGLEDGFGDQGRIEDHDSRSIARQARVETAHGRETACAGRILHDDHGLARDVLAITARQQAAILIVTATLTDLPL